MWLDDEFQHDVTLPAATLTNLTYHVFSVQELKGDVVVNCVDINTDEVVYSWVISISCPITSISQVYHVRVLFSAPKYLILHFANDTKGSVTLTVKSSNEELVHVITN